MFFENETTIKIPEKLAIIPDKLMCHLINHFIQLWGRSVIRVLMVVRVNHCRDQITGSEGREGRWRRSEKMSEAGERRQRQPLLKMSLT